jgi:alpha-1,6-mannosyltransferase
MHVLQLANFYHPRSGGLRTTVDALGAGYVAAGHRVSLVVPGARRLFTAAPGRDVITVRSPKLPGSGGYRTIVDRSAVVDLVRSLRPDVVELSDKTTLARIVLALPERPPTVLVSHERLDDVIGLRIPGRLGVARITDRWTRRLATGVDAVVCASAFAATEFERVGAGVLVHRVPLGVDLDVFAPPAERPERATAHAVMVTRLSAEKHPEMAIRAVRLLHRLGRPVSLTVVGDGPMRTALEDEAADLPVQFTGHVVHRREIARFLGDADVAVAPSPHETFGLAALEALACGTPVVAAADGAVGELIAPGTGAVAAPGVNGLAAAIDQALAGDRAAQRIAARFRAEQYPWSRSIASMLDVHASVAERAGRSLRAVS